MAISLGSCRCRWMRSIGLPPGSPYGGGSRGCVILIIERHLDADLASQDTAASTLFSWKCRQPDQVVELVDAVIDWFPATHDDFCGRYSPRSPGRVVEMADGAAPGVRSGGCGGQDHAHPTRAAEWKQQWLQEGQVRKASREAAGKARRPCWCACSRRRFGLLPGDGPEIRIAADDTVALEEWGLRKFLATPEALEDVLELQDAESRAHAWSQNHLLGARTLTFLFVRGEVLMRPNTPNLAAVPCPAHLGRRLASG